MGKDTRQLLRRARKAGAVITLGGSGHYRVSNPETGGVITMGVSSSDSGHALKKQIKDLRSIGIHI